MSKYFCSKLLNPGKGYPCIFRNWRATTHCNQWHGYDLMFEPTLECDPHDLTPEGWVYDFGKFGPLKERIEKHFDHTWLIAEDDPLFGVTLNYIHASQAFGQPCAKLIVLPSIGIEAFSLWLAAETTDIIYEEQQKRPSLKVRSARVFENNSNTGGYIV
jgi:6-pyruvoyltetrahydropterin/6-carboxytetrahydropterin synthase